LGNTLQPGRDSLLRYIVDARPTPIVILSGLRRAVTRPADDGQPDPTAADDDARTRWEARERARVAEQAHDAQASQGEKKKKGKGRSKSAKKAKARAGGKARKGGRKWWRLGRSERRP